MLSVQRPRDVVMLINIVLLIRLMVWIHDNVE